jgi:hypothetical protein
MAHERRNRSAEPWRQWRFRINSSPRRVLTVSWISSQNYTGSILAEGPAARCRRGVGPNPPLATLTYHRLGIAVETISYSSWLDFHLRKKPPTGPGPCHPPAGNVPAVTPGIMNKTDY